MTAYTKKYRGADLSEFNTVNSFDKLKNSVDFLILRCGYGGNYTDQDDAAFIHNAEMCEKLGIPYGVYLYSYAQNKDMAADEAEHVKRLINGRKICCGVWLDCEDDSLPKDRTGLTDTVLSFCSAMAEAGYTAGVYSSLYWFGSRFDERISSVKIWLAQWNDTNDYQGDSIIWQYTNKGRPDGVNTDTDMDLADERIFSLSAVKQSANDSSDSEKSSADDKDCCKCCCRCRDCD